MIKIKSAQEIEIMRTGGHILARVLRELEDVARAGVSLADLDELADKLIREAGATPSFKGYQPAGASGPYPGSVCLSLNDEVVHGLAGRRELKGGDILKIDVGVFYKGFHTDAAITVAIGNISKQAQELIAVTKEALNVALREVRAGATVGDIGYAVNEYVAGHGFSVVKELAGHGVGRELHEGPNVLNFGKKGSGEKLQEGMTLAVEPMVSAGKGAISQSEDGFAYKITDGSLAAHFEHTVAVTKDGNEVLTK